ncbi:Hpt domain-containing protein [Parapedomonas caeni]
MMSDDDWQDAKQALGDRIDDLRADYRRLPVDELARQIHSLKGLSAAYGQRAIAGLIHALEDDLRTQGRATPIASYLDMMDDMLDARRGADIAYLDLMLATLHSRFTAA